MAWEGDVTVWKEIGVALGLVIVLMVAANVGEDVFAWEASRWGMCAGLVLRVPWNAGAE